MENLSEKINQVSQFFLIVFFVIAFLSTVYQVVSRFILQSTLLKSSLPMIDFSIFNLTWIEELIRYLFVWIVFLGIGIVYKNRGHAQVEILHHYISKKLKGKLLMFIEIVNSGLFLFLIVYGWSILKFTSQQISPSLGINMTLIYCSVLICSIICLIHSLVNILGLFYKKRIAEDIHIETTRKNTDLG